MTIESTGHLKEQPTKVSHFRPELGVFHGYTYERISSGVIEVWLAHTCEHCKTPIRTEGFFVRTGAADEATVQRHGLKLFAGTKPIRGVKVHSSAPWLCESCKDKWLRGDSLAELGETLTKQVWAVW